MSVGRRKGILMVFATVTMVLALMSCYMLYFYFGVATATRMMEVSLLNFDVFHLSDSEISIKTDLRICNPSVFTFYVVWANEKLYQADGKPFGNIGGYWLKGGPVEVPSFSNVTLTISSNVIQVVEGQTKNLYLSFCINLDTPLPSDAKLDFSEEVSFST